MLTRSMNGGQTGRKLPRERVHAVFESEIPHLEQFSLDGCDSIVDPGADLWVSTLTHGEIVLARREE